MGATLPYPDKPANGQAPDADPIRLNLLALLSAIQGFDGSQTLSKTIIENGLADQVNPRLRDSGWQAPFVESGGWTASFSGLGWVMPSGIADYNGYRNTFTGANYTVAINNDTYYSVTQAGSVNSPQAVANGAAVPTLPANSQWLAKVISNGTAITSIVDLRRLGPITADKLDNPYKFSAYQLGDTAPAASTWTKATLNTKNFDTHSDFDATTNYRFTAPVAGFYQINAQIGLSVSGINSNNSAGALYKNGSQYLLSTQIVFSGNVNTINRPQFSTLLQLAAGDYIELYGFIGDVSRNIQGAYTWMNGFLVSRT